MIYETKEVRLEIDGKLTTTVKSYTHLDFQSDITILEQSYTERRKREADLDLPGAKQWVIDLNAKIEALRTAMNLLSP